MIQASRQHFCSDNYSGDQVGPDQPHFTENIVPSISVLITTVLITTVVYLIYSRTYFRLAQVTALPPMQSSSQDFTSHILESMPVVKYGKRNQEKLREVDLEINISKQLTSTTGSLTTLGNGGDQPVAADVRGSTAEAVDILDERMRPESRNRPLTCSVCTEDFYESDDIRVLPCRHIYHRSCIDPWLLDFGGNCPLR